MWLKAPSSRTTTKKALSAPKGGDARVTLWRTREEEREPCGRFWKTCSDTAHPQATAHIRPACRNSPQEPSRPILRGLGLRFEVQNLVVGLREGLLVLAQRSVPWDSAPAAESCFLFDEKSECAAFSACFLLQILEPKRSEFKSLFSFSSSSPHLIQGTKSLEDLGAA